jgi:acetyl-CoA C-acetyltransferase
MHALTAMQLCEEAGDMQIANPQLGGVFNMAAPRWRTT